MSVHAADLITGRAWAILPDALETIIAIAERTNEAPEAVAARLGRPLTNARRASERDGTAIVPVTGPIFRRANLFTEISGATSVELLARDLQAAADNPEIARIVLEIDSPGGEATGIAELAAQIRAIAKPVTAYVDGTAASAAYWLAAAADQIIASPTALLGSIGVVGTYRPEKDKPIRIISTQSPLKQTSPDTEVGRAEAQRIVDELAAVFVADVAGYRGTDEAAVLERFGRGGLLVGAAAVAAGMADAVGTFESLFQSAGRSGVTQRTITMSERTSPEITRETLAAEHPAILEAIEADARAAGTLAERARVSAILAAVADAPHARALADTAIAQGLSAEQTVALVAAVPVPVPAAPAVSGSGPSLEELRAAWLADAAQRAETADSAAGSEEVPSDPEAAARAKWDGNATLRAEFGGNFDRYQAFLKAESAGRVRILKTQREA